ncbi:hypothetical protein ASPACDRAFT_75060 [Aspergillus aculeatus ATCC 16872]|uniref:Uncharacterized protein n=1 Tax=Aspergillus aculeatus (strain ATCC 16872 / CBS 172.66 / WB 5094) TaxID=690307 RepID=A0A1L9X4V1_ASPA1|nr:uncharacterized protein ASPACDRAFT_75060 [Aspergillus aculeatus ATCC 16872]OJK03480.1 hypothetical protein ASPACDRAFT_75060 [Aspergillus aculeatus ATCC 16872]
MSYDEHDEEWQIEAQTVFKDVETYHWGYRIACLNCPKASAYSGPLNGIRFWFEKERYYVVVGCPPIISTKMAADGRWAKNISKKWDQWWQDTQTPRNAKDIWGFTEDDKNLYHVKGWGKEVLEGLDDLQRRLEIVLPEGYEFYGGSLVMRIKEGLRALDPSWEQTEKEYDAEYERAHAKDVVQSGPGVRFHRDGTTTTDNGWGFYS